MTRETGFPWAVEIFVCQTIVRRPLWTGIVSPMTHVPAGAAPITLVLLSIVVVPLPPTRFAPVARTPKVSAKAMMAPPCRIAGCVQNSRLDGHLTDDPSGICADKLDTQVGKGWLLGFQVCEKGHLSTSVPAGIGMSCRQRENTCLRSQRSDAPLTARSVSRSAG